MFKKKLGLFHRGDTQLRYSLALCDEEKRFIDTRKQKIFRAMKDILKVNAPRNMREVIFAHVLKAFYFCCCNRFIKHGLMFFIFVQNTV